MARPALELRMQNVPIINLRWEFRDQRRTVNDPSFRQQFEGEVKQFETSYFTWLGVPSAGTTLLSTAVWNCTKTAAKIAHFLR